MNEPDAFGAATAELAMTAFALEEELAVREQALAELEPEDA